MWPWRGYYSDSSIKDSLLMTKVVSSLRISYDPQWLTETNRRRLRLHVPREVRGFTTHGRWVATCTVFLCGVASIEADIMYITGMTCHAVACCLKKHDVRVFRKINIARYTTFCIESSPLHTVPKYCYSLTVTRCIFGAFCGPRAILWTQSGTSILKWLLTTFMKSTKNSLQAIRCQRTQSMDLIVWFMRSVRSKSKSMSVIQ